MGRDTANHTAYRLIGARSGHPWGKEISDWSLPLEGLAEKHSACPLSYVTAACFSFRPQFRELRPRAAFF